MPLKKKVSQPFFDLVDPLALELDNIRKDTERVVEKGILIRRNFRNLAIDLRRITRRSTIKVVSSVLSFILPVDIEELVDDVTTSALTVYKFVNNAGLVPLFAHRLRYYKYEEPDLSEFLDDLERLRDIIADMEFSKIDMAYSIDIVKAVESLLKGVRNVKSKSVLGAKKIVSSSVKMMRFSDKLGSGNGKKEEIEIKDEEKRQLETIAASADSIEERITAVKRDWPPFKEVVDELCKNLEPLLLQLNQSLGIRTKAKFEIYTDTGNQYRFRLRAPNGEIVAVGEAYTTKAACLNGINSVKKNSPIAKIKDLVKNNLHKYCMNCGTKLSEKDRVCPSCGSAST